MESIGYKTWWESFRVTGDICPVRLGLTRDELKAILGEPDAVGYSVGKLWSPSILRYDDLEFHFEKGSDGKLWLIYSELDDVPAVSIRVINEEPKG